MISSYLMTAIVLTSYFNFGHSKHDLQCTYYFMDTEYRMSIVNQQSQLIRDIIHQRDLTQHRIEQNEIRLQQAIDNSDHQSFGNELESYSINLDHLIKLQKMGLDLDEQITDNIKVATYFYDLYHAQSCDKKDSSEYEKIAIDICASNDDLGIHACSLYK